MDATADDLRRRVFPAVDRDPAVDQRHRIATLLRQLGGDLLWVDVAETGSDELAGLAADLEAVADRLASLPHHRRHGSLPATPLPNGAPFERGPISGHANVLAPPLRITFDGDVTRAQVTFGDAYEGPPGTVHGGFVAAAFDELVGAAQLSAGTAGVTGTLTVRYRRPTPLHAPVTYAAHVAGRTGRRLRIVATSHHGDSLVAEAEATMVLPR